MGTFLVGFSILQTLQILSKTPGRIRGLSSGSDCQGRSPPPLEGGGTGAVATGKTNGVVSSGWPALLFDCP
jgi:hypothetical protein